MRVGRVLLVAGVALAGTGCDGLFGLVEVTADARAPGDGDGDSPDTPRTDAGCTSTTVHDEDGDGVADDCDACPTSTGGGPGAADDDLDGLPTVCDANLSTSPDGDRILFSSVFKSTSELSMFYDTSGTGSAVTIANDRLSIPIGGQAALKKVLTPTAIVAAVASFIGTTSTEAIEIAANGVSCSVGTAGCAGESSQICVAMNTAGTTQAIDPSEVRLISVYQSSGMLHCRIDTASGSVTVDGPGSFTSSVPFVRSTGAVIELDSLVFYGEK